MARLARLEIAGGWYHVLNRGHQRVAIFRDRRCYADFLDRLSQLPERFGLKIHAYVLLPNHYHLELELGEPPMLSAAMHWLNTGYGIWFNRRYSRVGALFQGRFKAILFDPDECLLAIHNYIHLNPVRVGTLSDKRSRDGVPDRDLLLRRRQVLRQYEWSSYRNYAGLRVPARWLTTETVLHRCGMRAKEYRRGLDRLITQDRLELDWQGEVAAGIMMGSREAVKGWKRLLSEQNGAKKPIEYRRFALVRWEEVVTAVEREFGQPWQELLCHRGNPARALAIWFGRHRAGMTLEQIRAELGASSYAAVAMKVSRMERQLPHQRALRARLQAIAKRLDVKC